MYHPVGVEKLSQNQISKLLRGHNVRVKHGGAMNLHLSPQQHKKLMSAHRKGAGCCISFDPYQQDLHRGGEGMKSLLRDVGSKVVPVASSVGRAVLPVASDLAQKVAPVAIDVGAQALKDYVAGKGVSASRSTASRSSASRSAPSRSAPRRRGRGLAGDLTQAVAPVLVDVGAQALKNYVGKKGKKGGALYPAGYSEGRGKIGSVVGQVLGETFIPF